MHKAISIFFVLVAAGLLVTGYTARERYDKYHEFWVRARIDTRIENASRAGKIVSTESPLDGFDEVADTAEKRTVELTGTVQYCAGWIVFGLAAVLWCLPELKRTVHIETSAVRINTENSG